MTILRSKLTKSGLVMLCGVLLTACQNMPNTLWMHQAETTAAEPSEENTSVTISDLYSTPAFDAQIALSVHDLRLLTFAQQTTLPPGVPARFKLDNVTKHCGLRALPSPAVSLDASFDARQRQTLLNYATQYNQVIISACERIFGRSLR
ncbi:hypothetical protein [Alteromonas sp. a30]|uniref:hypothetical protein n=1 Tax=Alteromonas sp. a30 TaxID=2730917 RepID=UPI002282C189|nr:hypothetical protein [Alteromonas sp. a30]MCY7294622.1 hypothetical protein [Alteromonas sp. a30]